MPKKFYVVWNGLETGVFDTWDQTLKLVNKVPGAKYKSFPSRAEAELAFKSGAPARSTGSKKARSKKKTPTTAKLPVADVTIFCDGACEPNPGKSGSGIAVYRGSDLAELYYGLYNPNGTNNTAELNALHQSLLIAETELGKNQSVAVLSDSMYSINCITQWAASWEKRGWKKKDGEIKNLELIKTIYTLFNRFKSQISLTHVKAHAGTEGNELADRMSIIAVERKEPEFRQFTDAVDVPALLKMRAG